MTSRDDRWLVRACRDHRLPPYAFRVAFAIMRMQARGSLRTTSEQLMQASGARSLLTLLHSIDRLAMHRYLTYDREVRGGPLLIDIIHDDH